MFAFLQPYLPQASGLLPKWMLFVAFTAVFNSVQNFVTTKLTQQVYSNVHVTSIQARTFAVWTLASAAIRMYAAYNITEKHVYDLALISYLIAFGHFASEILIFKSTGFNRGSISPVIVSTVSLIWMFQQYEFYTRP
ncbi:Erg28-like protein [Cylindrobasidium torrendii FP15055 ss-10]|uniref:Erg28-like protein n=1 Tax=Cylindrobasidium torrendii FP15055 ss-10 TaxID=1314674 RepID=A0A0D7BPL7_9AGAR|nr:Erg28-like protein [Cylindrobasidium torrendii FP15055 ss-10]